MGLGERTVHIEDPSAPEAREVMVLAGVAIEARMGAG